MNNHLERQNIFSHDVLIATLEQLKAINGLTLVEEIKRILATNQIPKPALHNKPGDITTSYYLVDLTCDQAETISDLFLQLECQSVSKDGNTTPLASYYADLFDKWNEFN